MKRLLLLLTMSLTWGASSWSANITDDPAYLHFGSVYVEGSLCANQMQRLHVIVTNTGDTDYSDNWYILDNATNKQIEFMPTELLFSSGTTDYPPVIHPGETRELTYDFTIKKPGDYVCKIVARRGGALPTLITFSVSLTEERTPRLHGTLQIDMLEVSGRGNKVYGDFTCFRVSGVAIVTNEENYPLMGVGDGSPENPTGVFVINELMYDADESDSYYYPWYRGLCYEMKAGETITVPFTYIFKGKIEEGKQYAIHLHAFGTELDRVTFTPQSCTNTYWTANGDVKPLPQDGMTLTIPAEAAAVDFRGNYNINGIYTVDAAKANPNCIYYLNSLDYVPRGLDYSCWVVRDGEIRDFVVNRDHEYFCPMQFHAKTAIMAYRPKPNEEVGSGTYAAGMGFKVMDTMMLPFDATKAVLTDLNGAETDFSDGWLCFFRYDKTIDGILDHETRINFSTVKDKRLTAYEPYLFGVRNSSPVTFYGEDVTIPVTRPVSVEGDYFDFVAFPLEMDSRGVCFKWDREQANFFLDLNKYQIAPFTPVLRINERWYEEVFEIPLGGDNPPTVDPNTSPPLLFLLTPSIFGDDVLSSVVISRTEKEVQVNTAVYSLSGQYMGGMGESSLKPGLYIVGGKKRVVR